MMTQHPAVIGQIGERPRHAGVYPTLEETVSGARVGRRDAGQGEAQPGGFPAERLRRPDNLADLTQKGIISSKIMLL